MKCKDMKRLRLKSKVMAGIEYTMAENRLMAKLNRDRKFLGMRATLPRSCDAVLVTPPSMSKLISSESALAELLARHSEE
jgi:hypothetical protein